VKKGPRNCWRGQSDKRTIGRYRRLGKGTIISIELEVDKGREDPQEEGEGLK